MLWCGRGCGRVGWEPPKAGRRRALDGSSFHSPPLSEVQEVRVSAASCGPDMLGSPRVIGLAAAAPSSAAGHQLEVLGWTASVPRALVQDRLADLQQGSCGGI